MNYGSLVDTSYKESWHGKQDTFRGSKPSYFKVAFQWLVSVITSST